jgi:class 3 adenylate cyclase/tetratricopeptide (TPR) repeat protein
MEEQSALEPTTKHPHRSADADELRPVTALFADVVGSTGLGERLDPAEVKAVIGECVTRMCETVEAFGGRVTGQMGDGIAAFFGLHKAREDDAARAARAALEIRTVVAAFADEVRDAWGIEELNVRIGVNSGRVAAGPIGAQDEIKIALGDAVNVAARLQAAARPGGIVVGIDVAEALTGRFVFDDVGLLTVKGRAEAVRACELIGVVDQPLVSYRDAFVGRSRELDDSLSTVAELDSGRGQVLMVVGDAGIGKTRLLAELKLRSPADTLWLGATCDPLDSRLPYEPIDQMLRGYLGIDRRARDIHVRTRFRTAMKEVLGEQYDECAPQLARILGVQLEERLMRRLDGLPLETLKSELHAAVARWVATVAIERSVVVAIDNLHDASPATCELVSYLVEHLETLPVLIILTMRHESISAGWQTRIGALANHAGRCVDLVLRPLSADASRQLVEALDSAASLDDRLRDVIVDRAEGNPLYIEQLLSAVRVEDESSLGTIPRALESFLLSRIDALSTTARRALQVAAVLGRVFPVDILTSVTGGESAGAVAELLRADILREHRRKPREYTFKHGLLREAALSTLTEERRRTLHRSAAAAIESWPDFEVESHGEQLVRHLVASGGSSRAGRCLEDLGDRLLLVYRTADAATAYERALNIMRAKSLPDFFRLALKQCDLLGVTGDVGTAIALAEEALRYEPSQSTRDALLLAKARRLGEADRVDEVDVVLSELMTLTRDPEILGPALAMRAWLALGRQDIDVAEEAVTRLSALGNVSNDVAYERASLVGGIAAARGEFKAAHEAVRRAQTIAEELGKVETVLVARRRVGVTAYLAGAIREGYENLYGVFTSYRELGSVIGQLETAVNLTTCALVSGEFESGREVAMHCLSLTEEPAWRAMLLANLSGIEIELGNFTEVATLLDQLAAVEEHAPPWCGLVRRTTEANLLCAEGKWDEADLLVAEIVAEARSQLREGELAYLELLHADIAVALELWDEASERSARALARLDSSEALIAVQIERNAALIEARRDPRQARSRLEAAHRRAKDGGMRLEEARCLVAIGEIDRDKRSSVFAEAREIFERCGCQRGLQELERAQAATNSRLSPV